MKKENVEVPVASTAKSFGNLNDKNKKTIFIIIGVLLIAAIGGVIGYKVLSGNSENIYEYAVDDMANSLIEVIENIGDNTVILDTSDNSARTSGSIVFNSSMAGLEGFSGAGITFDAILDYKNDGIYTKLGLTQNENEFLDVKLLTEGNKVLIESLKLFNFLISMDLEDYVSEINFPETNLEDIIKSINKIADAINSSMSSDKFSKEDITILGEKLTAHVYNMDSKELKTLMNEIANIIEQDEFLVNTLAELAGYSVEDMKNALSTDVTLDENSNLLFHIYTKGSLNNYVGYGIGSNDEIYFSYTDIDNDVYMIGDEELTIKLDINDDITTITGLVNGKKDSSFGEAIIKKVNDGKYDIKYSSSSLNAESTVEFNKESEDKSTIKISVDIDDINLVTEFITETNVEMPTLEDLTTYDINTISESQISEITTNFFTAVSGTYVEDLITLVSLMFSDFSTLL